MSLRCSTVMACGRTTRPPLGSLANSETLRSMSAAFCTPSAVSLIFSGGFGRLHEGDVCVCLRMQHDRDTTDVRRHLSEYLQPFACYRALKNWKTGKVSIGPRYIFDEAAAHGIADEYKYDRYGLRFLLHNLRNEIGATRNYVWDQTDQLFGENSRLVGIGGSPTQFDPDITAFGPT